MVAYRPVEPSAWVQIPAPALFEIRQSTEKMLKAQFFWPGNANKLLFPIQMCLAERATHEDGLDRGARPINLAPVTLEFYPIMEQARTTG